MQHENNRLRWKVYVLCMCAIVCNVVVVFVAGSVDSRMRQVEHRMVSLHDKITVTSPADVLREVQRVYDEQHITQEQIRQMIKGDAPWVSERKDWLEWRSRVNEKLSIGAPDGNK